MEKNIIPYFSITIPTYGYEGKGKEFLEFSFNKLSEQTFNDFNVIISDHSIDDTIKDVCDKWSKELSIIYIRNEIGRGIISPNINVAMKNATGKWIKILFQDDFLYDEKSLQHQFEFIEKNSNMLWFATTFMHSNDGYNFYRHFVPKWHDLIWTGDNTIGCPSGITIKNKDLIFFDEELNWLMDCDYYTKMTKNFGPPSILPMVTIINRTWGKRLTDTTPQELKNKEFEILKLRYV
jgi:hypothetical protein